MQPTQKQKVLSYCNNQNCCWCGSYSIQCQFLNSNSCLFGNNYLGVFSTLLWSSLGIQDRWCRGFQCQTRYICVLIWLELEPGWGLTGEGVTSSSWYSYSYSVIGSVQRVMCSMSLFDRWQPGLGLVLVASIQLGRTNILVKLRWPQRSSVKFAIREVSWHFLSSWPPAARDADDETHSQTEWSSCALNLAFETPSYHTKYNKIEGMLQRAKAYFLLKVREWRLARWDGNGMFGLALTIFFSRRQWMHRVAKSNLHPDWQSYCYHL